MIINKYNKYKQQYQKDQQTVNSFDNLYRKNLEDKSNYENECKPLFNFFTKFLDVTKIDFFKKYEL